MKQEEIINNVLAQAKDHVAAASDNYKLGHYDWSLFIWHLALEKSIKALIVKQGGVPPHIHDLVKLTREARLEISKTKQEELVTITKFNLNTRYDDDKRRFYKMVTKAYASKWVKICEDIYVWIHKQF